ncbi:MAG: Ig-like domain-containing protein [Candidatus Latescibacterota bacterium]|nr:Ig-like domain-containing protein [Candidatus Latescibacterota bacterium]
MKVRTVLRWATCVPLIGVVSCAKVGPPSGGKADKTSPRVLSTVPAANATGVTADASILVVFDEVMDRKRTEEAIFLAPRSDFKFDWQGGDRVELQIGGGLIPDRTYNVTIGIDARDRRGNRLEESFSLAFATGDDLDLGRMKGRVIDASFHSTKHGAFVWAYDLATFHGVLGVEPPAYVTQSGSDGKFTIESLAPSTYRLLAFVDGNRNQSFDNDEMLAVPASDVVVEDDSTAGEVGDLLLIDTGSLVLERATTVHTRSIVLIFDRDIASETLAVSVKGLEIEDQYIVPGSANRLYLTTAEQEAGREYEVRVDIEGGMRLKPEESLRGSGRADRRPPEVLRNHPEGNINRAPELELLFSEAMASSTPPFPVIDDGDLIRVLDGEWAWTDHLRLVFTPTEPLMPGEFEIRVDLTAVLDLAGQAPADSVATWSVTLLDSFDHGALIGTVTSKATRIVVTSAQGEEIDVVADSTFALTGLTPGKYQVRAFRDLDGVGAPSPGELDPFRPAEPYLLFGEVRVSAAETATIEILLP